MDRKLIAPSYVDKLAEKAAEKLGCEISIIRVEKPALQYIPARVDGYHIQFRRKGAIHITPKLTVQGAKVLLATLCDLTTMRFIDGKIATNTTP